MPIYSYRCDACGHQADVLQKMSDAPLTVCPACGAAAYRKQVTAAGFQLKGSGWYATDFKNGSSKPATAGGKADAAGTSSGSATSESAPSTSSTSGASSSASTTD